MASSAARRLRPSRSTAKANNAAESPMNTPMGNTHRTRPIGTPVVRTEVRASGPIDRRFAVECAAAEGVDAAPTEDENALSNGVEKLSEGEVAAVVAAEGSGGGFSIVAAAISACVWSDDGKGT